MTLYFHPWQYLVRCYYIVTLYFHSWQYLVRCYYIVTLYFHCWQYFVRGWLYRDIIFSLLTVFGQGVIISWHYIFTPDNIWSGVIILWHYIFTAGNISWGGDYIVTLYFHSWQYFVRGWLYCDMIFSPLTIFGQGVIISWHYVFTPGNIWWGGDYILTYFHSWQYLVRGWIYRDIIFSLPRKSDEGVSIYHNVLFSFPTIFRGVDYIVTLYFHPWQYLVKGWFYRDIIFSPLTVFGEVLLYCDIIFSLLAIFGQVLLYCDIIFSLLAIFREGMIISWHYIFTPDSFWSGGDYIVTLYFHSWQYLVRCYYIVTLYFHCWQYFVRGWLYRDIIFSLLAIFREGVIILWHDILTPDNIWSGGDYIVTLCFHSWQYLVRGWLYPDIFSLLTIFSEGVNISWHYIFTPDNIWWGGDYIVTLYFHSWLFGAGVIISWHYIFTPGNNWWVNDYIVTLYFHSWQYLVRGWLYHGIFSLLKIFGEGVTISWHYNIISDTTLESGTGGDYIWIFSLSKFDSAVIPGF